MAKKLKFKDYLKALKLIKADPKLQSRFDTNQDGVLDPDELEAGAAIYGREIQPKSEPKSTPPKAKSEADKTSQAKGQGTTDYLAKNLLSGETLIYHTRVHKIIFASTAIWLVFSIGWLSAKWLFAEWIDSPFEEYRWTGVAIVMSIGLLHFVLSYIYFISSEFGLTNQRVIVKTGLFSRTTMELFLKKVESVQVHQSILGRALGYGTVLITGTGGNSDPFKAICDPLRFKEQVQMQLSAEKHQS